ncbi:heterocycloanthracin/sonorensin family bacteriocin [Paenibacillus sp. LMG 31456]|uniref:Heterocycloanthracin/sonorensin family bacteriocin n=1 Tax=Paenibacillus foliorum TaxID=2654974 RepID=A0A972GKZ9_9BACL|nr:heterocycloanthracin/sonorensin family bacteriocin [Paenibacillus foliorum]NOU91955.1 heterocycloanthracin/sonorensin family bacteriocin [Paenibacillus foliorum]
MEVFTMNNFQNELQQLNVSQFQAGEVTPWNQQNQYPTGQFPNGVNPADPSRLCVGFGRCGGFCGGFCAGVCGGFCAGVCGGFCSGFCSGFCHHQCGGFCHHRCR